MLRVKYVTNNGEAHTRAAIDAFVADNDAKSGICVQFYGDTDKLLFVETKC